MRKNDENLSRRTRMNHVETTCYTEIPLVQALNRVFKSVNSMISVSGNDSASVIAAKKCKPRVQRAYDGDSWRMQSLDVQFQAPKPRHHRPI